MTSTFNEEALLILVLEIGVVIIFSLIAAKVLGKRGIPQVLGLIFAGIALQFLTFYTSFPTPPTPEIHYIVTTGALGYIGYGIGAHLDLRRLLNESWGLPLILIGEAIGSFLIVSIIVTLVFQNHIIGLLVGSIAMATAPASTAEVIREYKAMGPLSQTVLFIIAFDDILAIIFFNIILSYSGSFFSGIDQSLVKIIIPIILELVGSSLLGITFAFIMSPFHIEGVKAYQSAEFVFPAVLVCIALSGLLHLSVILSCIVFGLTLSNMAKCENKLCVRGVERLASPIIALFFILVGYEMNLLLLFSPIIFGISAYFIARAIGKSVGSYSSARIAKMPRKVTQNIPFTLLTQAGVAVGLAAFAVTRLNSIGTDAV